MYNQDSKGQIVFFNGLSGSGKSAMADRLVPYWKGRRGKVFSLDGDVTREFFGNDLGYSPEERLKACKRNAFGAKLLSDNGVNVVMSIIMSTPQLREYYEEKLDFIEILMDADINDCIKNDPKGLYTKKLALDKPETVGIDIPFPRPKNPDLILSPYNETPDQSFDRVVDFLNGKGIFTREE